VLSMAYGGGAFKWLTLASP